MYNGTDNQVGLTARILVTNTGIRSGVLFSLRIDPVDPAITLIKPKKSIEWTIPLTLAPGKGWDNKVTVLIQLPDEKRYEYLNSRDYIIICVEFEASASFGRIRKRNELLRIDIKPTRASAVDWNLD